MNFYGPYIYIYIYTVTLCIQHSNTVTNWALFSDLRAKDILININTYSITLHK